MRPLKRIELDFDPAWQYIKDQLEGGNTLSHELLKRINFMEGAFFIMLPEEANLNHLYQFRYGGLMPPGIKKQVTVLNHTYQAELVNSITSEVADYLLKIVQQGKVSCLFEDVTRKTSDPGLNFFSDRKALFTHEKEVYYGINADNCSYEVILSAIQKSNAIWHFLGAVFKNHILQYELSQHELSNICSSVEMLIFGAYDREGYFFWERT